MDLNAPWKFKMIRFTVLSCDSSDYHLDFIKSLSANGRVDPKPSRPVEGIETKKI